VTADGGDATEKPKALAAGAVRRVAAHVNRRRAPARPDLLAADGGIGGSMRRSPPVTPPR
jgi:hypothetical protein